MREHTVLRIVSQLVIAPMLLYALYVQFHGEYSPGGGFQAGVILATAIILYGLIFGVEAAREAVPPTLLRVGAAGGLLIYGGTGVATILLGGNFLDYDRLFDHGGQHYGLIIIELGVGITVASVMIAIFYVFAGRGRQDDPDSDEDHGSADDYDADDVS
ncbi:MAG: cation:proton antiporter [Xanthomonadales bacterium]|nr:cation:proton antiporter [Xanthomonadales bacterium]|tara:strand:+ start:2902 stop:3378 length:477 start_codon:yes stop_codon:yes gene_type:complete